MLRGFTLYMKIHLIMVGKTTDANVKAMMDDYTSRIKHYISFELEVISELKNSKSLTEAQQKAKEGELILKAIKPSDQVYLLDEGGREFRSIEFAEFIGKCQQTVSQRLVFVIGGPYGFSREIYDAAKGKISLSRMTFSHQMVRAFFTEQCYRAMTILRGEPYHHE